MINKTALTVEQLNDVIKEVIENEEFLNNITVRGELQGFKKHSTGHYFFKLIDKNAQINAVIYSFKANYMNLSSLKDGDEIEATGSISFYNKRGDISFNISKISLSGEGDKLLQKKLLLEKLQKEGLFDGSHKKPIPSFPKKIGIITSDTGATIEDIKKNIFSRYKLAELYIFPCLVQGDGAKKSIINAIQKTKEYNLDTIIIGRGGGSKEDLSAFDDEEIARAIFDLTTPVISAIGHEIDKSVVDFVADVSVSTPTAAAIECVPLTTDIIQYLDDYSRRLNVFITNLIEKYQTKINSYTKLNIFNNINNVYENIENRLVNYKNILNNYYNTTIYSLTDKIESLKKLLDSINIKTVLSKGYAIITNNNDELLCNKNDIEKNEELKIRVKDGTTIVRRKL